MRSLSLDRDSVPKMLIFEIFMENPQAGRNGTSFDINVPVPQKYEHEIDKVRAHFNKYYRL